MRMLSRSALLAGLIALAGCVTAPASQQPAPLAQQTPQARPSVGLTGVMNTSARALQARFGRPVLDVREGTARKLQFVNRVCVLDAYLYPPRQGAEPIVTHIDARLPDGRDIDRASCVASFGLR